MRALLVVLALLVSCAKEDVKLPNVEPVPEDLQHFTEPRTYVPPPPAPPPVLPGPPVPPAKNEQRYAWEDGETYPVAVQIGYPTVTRYQPNEKILHVVDGDTGLMSETEEARQQQGQEKDTACHYGAKWQYCRSISETRFTPVENIAFTATHVSQKQGVVVYTDQRMYYLELQAVKSTPKRIISWKVPEPPPVPPAPKEPGLFPDLAEPRTLHIGYTLTIPHATPDWTVVKVWSDLPTAASAKMYLQFGPALLHQRFPLIRGMDYRGKPYLLNARKYGTWVVVDELADRLEIRRGADEYAQVVVVTREQLRPIHCPGDVECPVWPH